MIRLAISGGAGRMGRTLAALAAADGGFEVVGGIDRVNLPPGEAQALGFPRVRSMDSAGEVLRAADVVLDFSAPAGLSALLRGHADALAGRALVVGTTGLGEAEHARLKETERRTAVLVAANFSIGINLLLSLAEQAARALPAQEYDVEIVEAHHRHKADAPSGTALALGRAVAAGRGEALERLRRDGRSGELGERPAGQIGFHALRGGEVAGEHRVLFLGGRERIELAHAASERAIFAEGALAAARWIAGREAGRYEMREVLGL
ncbi:MAG TPA: 4-hydroxy-tetrahydrodipicolinate reductase [Longimicrobiales bacterium]|nr:4-hydroxy-tetrahydrodipicolinate reductase [Longimicrobiales bacterium]